MNHTETANRQHSHILIIGGIVFAAVLAFFVLQSPTLVHGQAECAPGNINNSGQWDTDFCQTNIDIATEVRWGGVPRDGIPPIDNPLFESISEASDWLDDRSPVVAVEVNDIARAYPLAILTRHEIVNDNFGDAPVAVTFCPLCNSAIAFDRVVDGQTLRLGVSGYLRNSDLIMWDDVTESWWQQLTGEGIVGEFTGTQLRLIPSQVVSFSAFADQFPNGEVLADNNGRYGRNPYVGYDSNPRPFLFGGEIDTRLESPTERVLAGTIGGEAIAYPFEALAEELVINDVVGERPVVALWQPGKASALDESVIDESRDVGMATLYNREIDIPEGFDNLEVNDNDRVTLTFAIVDGEIVDEQTESTWNIFGVATAGPLEGTELQQELAAPHFWFAWAAFKPETRVYGLE